MAISIAACTDAGVADEAIAEQDLGTVNAATLFSDGNQFGTSLTILVPPRGFEVDDNLPASFDNIVSSLTVRPMCTISLYLDPDQGGAAISYSGGSTTTTVVPILPLAFDNAVSSYSAYCVPHCPIGQHWCGPDTGCTSHLCE